jgi:hypothetical protein
MHKIIKELQYKDSIIEAMRYCLEEREKFMELQSADIERLERERLGLLDDLIQADTELRGIKREIQQTIKEYEVRK